MRKYIIAIALIVLTACDDSSEIKRVTDLSLNVEIVCIDDVLYFAAKTYNGATIYSPKYKTDSNVETCEIDDEYIADIAFYGGEI